MPAGKNAIPTWLHTAAPGFLLPPPQLVRRAVITTASTGAMTTRANCPSTTVATTSAAQLLRGNAQAVGQRIIIITNLQHDGPCHGSLLIGSSGPAGRLPPVHSCKWTETLPRVVYAAASAISAAASTCSTPAHPKMKSVAFCACAPATINAFGSDRRNLSQLSI